MISAQTSIVYGALARRVLRQSFGGAAVAGVMGAFVSIIVTGPVFYFFQPGEPFRRAALGRAGDGGSVLSGLADFVLLQIPGVTLCSAMIGWGEASAAPHRAWLMTAGAVLAVISNFWALSALTALADQW